MGPHVPDQALAAWCDDSNRSIEPLPVTFESDRGYPPGVNRVVEAGEGRRGGEAAARADLPPALAMFYRTIHEVLLPDVGNGYFVHPLDHVLDELTRLGPVRLPGSCPGVVFGSDGGGIRLPRPAAPSRDRVHRHRTTGTALNTRHTPTCPATRQHADGSDIRRRHRHGRADRTASMGGVAGIGLASCEVQHRPVTRDHGRIDGDHALAGAGADDVRGIGARVLHVLHGLELTLTTPTGSVEVRGLTASLGAALFVAHGDTVDLLLLMADSAQRVAKGAGRDRFVLAPLPSGIEVPVQRA